MMDISYTSRWYTYPSEKSVNWDDELPNVWKHKSHVPNHKAVDMSYRSSCHFQNHIEITMNQRAVDFILF